VRGLDFKIAKTSKGGYADYTTSNWSRRERALSEEENESIAKHGLFDLKTFLPKKPTDVELKVMKDKGAFTIVQNKESSVVFGMPGEALSIGAADQALSPEKIAEILAKSGSKK